MSVITEQTTVAELQLELAKRSVRQLTVRSMPPPSMTPMNTAELHLWGKRQPHDRIEGTGVTVAAAIDDAIMSLDNRVAAQMLRERAGQTDG